MTKTELDAYLRKIMFNEEPAFVSDSSRNDSMQGLTIKISNLEDIPGERVKIVKHGRFLSVPEHGHDYFEMMYVYDGSITHYIEGDKIILNKGSICLLDPKVKHSTAICGEDDIAVNLCLSRTTAFLRIFSQTPSTERIHLADILALIPGTANSCVNMQQR